MAKGDMWYRVEDRYHAGPADANGGAYKITSVVLREFEVVWETGFTVTLTDGVETLTRLKRRTIGWASPTVEEATECFYRRKAYQKTKLQNKIRRLDDAISYARLGQLNRIKLPKREI